MDERPDIHVVPPIESSPAVPAQSGQSGEQVLTIGQVVERLEPLYHDVTISSLRFLEQQGLLLPRRTPGGHRQYTTRDVERVRHIKELQRQRYSLGEIRHHLRQAPEVVNLEGLAETYLAHVLAGDPAHALGLAMRAVHGGVSVEEVYMRVLTPAMVRVGQLWAAGEVSVAEEHLATAITRHVMALLKDKLPTGQPRGLRAVAAGPPGELHELGLRMVADLFESAGWEVDYLGPNTPTDALLGFMTKQRPHLLLLAVGAESGLRPCADVIAAVRAARDVLGRVLVGVGGPAFEGRETAWREMGADFSAYSADEAVAKALSLISTP